VHRLPPTILSGRGIVYLRREPQHRQIFHLLGSHWRLERGSPWGRDVPSTRLLLAGVGSTRGAPMADHARAQSGDDTRLAPLTSELT
jgi:hypothetical protein